MGVSLARMKPLLSAAMATCYPYSHPQALQAHLRSLRDSWISAFTAGRSVGKSELLGVRDLHGLSLGRPKNASME